MKRTIIVPLLVMLLMGSLTWADSPDKHARKLIIDADTGNEIDDFYAIVRALIEPSFHVLAVNSAQYHTQAGAPDNTVQISQDFNEQILRVMGLDIPHPLGANETLPDVNTPRPSEASQTIIDAAQKLPEGESLDVVVFGPMTNVASAILQDSSIVPKLRVHIMGLRFDPETGEWNKNEFNTNNDPNAMDILLNRKGLNLHVMTATTSSALIFYKTEVEEHLRGKGGIWDLLNTRWDEYLKVMTWSSPHANDVEWIMWDVAIVEALANPEVATQEKACPPSENTQREIYVYTDIDVPAMKEAFWQSVTRAMH